MEGYCAWTNAPDPGACVALDGPDGPVYPPIAETATLADAEVIATALNTARGAVSILRDMTDPDPCRYDHNGLCQAHSLHQRPCPHERGRALLGGQYADSRTPPRKELS